MELKLDLTTGVDSRSGQTKDLKTWHSQLPAWRSALTRDSVKPPPCVVDK